MFRRFSAGDFLLLYLNDGVPHVDVISARMGSAGPSRCMVSQTAQNTGDIYLCWQIYKRFQTRYSADAFTNSSLRLIESTYP